MSGRPFLFSGREKTKDVKIKFGCSIESSEYEWGGKESRRGGCGVWLWDEFRGGYEVMWEKCFSYLFHPRAKSWCQSTWKNIQLGLKIDVVFHPLRAKRWGIERAWAVSYSYRAVTSSVRRKCVEGERKTGLIIRSCTPLVYFISYTWNRSKDLFLYECKWTEIHI